MNTKQKQPIFLVIEIVGDTPSTTAYKTKEGAKKALQEILNDNDYPKDIIKDAVKNGSHREDDYQVYIDDVILSD